MGTVRGIRGAITVEDAGTQAVSSGTMELLEELTRLNDCSTEDMAAAIFTLTGDLAGAAPAAVARKHGWEEVPVLQVLEHGGATSVPRCIRVLLLWNTDAPQSAVRHAYLREAASLRADVTTARAG
ncbi:MAG: chorismate mutase [Actinomycetota bacterium]|nr:chorismate mutase [Actinomycetota bacterium]